MVEKNWKKGTETCGFCHNKIELDTDHFVLLGTFNRMNNGDDVKYYHFDCWIEFFNRAVKMKATAITKSLQVKAMELVNNPVLKGVLSSIKGADQLQSMLSMPLGEQAEEKKTDLEKIAKKIQDDRRKHKQNNRKRKPRN